MHTSHSLNPKLKKIYLLLFILFSFSSAFCQNDQFEFKIVDYKSGQEIPFLNIYLDGAECIDCRSIDLIYDKANGVYKLQNTTHFRRKGNMYLALESYCFYFPNEKQNRKYLKSLKIQGNIYIVPVDSAVVIDINYPAFKNKQVQIQIFNQNNLDSVLVNWDNNISRYVDISKSDSTLKLIFDLQLAEHKISLINGIEFEIRVLDDSNKVIYYKRFNNFYKGKYIKVKDV